MIDYIIANFRFVLFISLPEIINNSLDFTSFKCYININFSFRRCPFCDWSCVGSDTSQLDRHYWKTCPFLSKCPQCSQVLEVAALNYHLTSKFNESLYNIELILLFIFHSGM